MNVLFAIYHSSHVSKITDLTNTNTPKVLVIEYNMFLRPEEAMLLAWQKLVSSL